MSTFSLTHALLICDDSGYQKATQSEFLRLAANGKTSKEVLGEWLANDRLYIHSYVRGIGRLIGFLQFPDTAPAPDQNPDAPTRLLDWFVSALLNIRREEKFFVKTAAQYGIQINLETQDGRVPRDAKLEGLRRWEALFEGVSPGVGDKLPWLEAAIVYWGTEKCYLDAWSWAKSQLTADQDASQDADGGALRNEFIDNWTSREFAEFVSELGHIIDDAVREEIDKGGENTGKQFLARGRAKWTDILSAEEMFWPKT
ncbi:hypothetical protein B0T10DRAFT_587547 [Thelonectria olida]|uniref:Heme oxygenase-like protein n=1 Tax=Thelonectria olida TaxID=1576542 RepID=A0A9P8WB47_9HYPO|nr:hypothetical protein B0T10DRAFT_587547 [Thelonectria olida]